jgi:zinc protease
LEVLEEALGLPGELRVERLDNGLTVVLAESRQAPLVAPALFYRGGAADESRGEEGIAHFLEHMMFKGSERYPAGEIDRRTQALGGSSNAFTSHDSTAYHFSFSGDRWHEALAIEADRMVSLTLDPAEVETERQVIVEEIGMYEDDPWDSLELALGRDFYGAHPYGRPILGTRESLAGIGADELRAFHRRYYTPANAVLVLAGDVDVSAAQRVRALFGAIPPGEAPAPPAPSPLPGAGQSRHRQRKGDVGRLLVAHPAPGADHADHAPLRLLAAVLGGGRASRLYRALVDEGQLCVSASCEVTERVLDGMTVVAAELVPGVEPAAVEERVLFEIERLRRRPPSPEEVERARRTLIADWVFGIERVEHLALATGHAVSLFDADYPARRLRALAGCGPERLARVAERYLGGGRRAVAWSLPEEGDR